jgi:hypothetical protein
MEAPLSRLGAQIDGLSEAKRKPAIWCLTEAGDSTKAAEVPGVIDQGRPGHLFSSYGYAVLKVIIRSSAAAAPTSCGRAMRSSDQDLSCSRPSDRLGAARRTIPDRSVRNRAVRCQGRRSSRDFRPSGR